MTTDAETRPAVPSPTDPFAAAQTRIDEIADGIYRLATPAPPGMMPGGFLFDGDLSAGNPFDHGPNAVEVGEGRLVGALGKFHKRDLYPS